jgi:hypothetical protein
MLTVRSFGNLRFIVYPLILSLLSCAAPGADTRPKEPESITVDRAKELFTQGHKARFPVEFGRYYEGAITGWDETGFIGMNSGRVDTIKYDAITNVIQIETNKRQTGKGAGVGFMLSLIPSAFIWIAAVDEYKHDNGDMRGLALIGAGVVTVGLMFIGTVAGGALGISSHKYAKYYFNRDDFKANPWHANDSLKSGNVIMED